MAFKIGSAAVNKGTLFAFVIDGREADRFIL